MKRKKCYICNQHKLITELHKCVPNKYVKKQDKKLFLNSEYYLCPNCHTYVHKYLDETEKGIYINVPDIIDYFSENKIRFIEVVTDNMILKQQNKRFGYKELIRQYVIEKYYKDRANEIMQEIIEENSNIVGIYEDGELVGLHLKRGI